METKSNKCQRIFTYHLTKCSQEVVGICQLCKLDLCAMCLFTNCAKCSEQMYCYECFVHYVQGDLIKKCRLYAECAVCRLDHVTTTAD